MYIYFLKRVWIDLQTLHEWISGVKTRWNSAFFPNVGSQNTTNKEADSTNTKDNEYLTNNDAKLKKEKTVASEYSKGSIEKHSSGNLLSLHEDCAKIHVPQQSDMDKLKTKMDSMTEKIDEGNAVCVWKEN